MIPIIWLQSYYARRPTAIPAVPVEPLLLPAPLTISSTPLLSDLNPSLRAKSAAERASHQAIISDVDFMTAVLAVSGGRDGSSGRGAVIVESEDGEMCPPPLKRGKAPKSLVVERATRDCKS
jgi:hypothetical protein